MKTDPRMTPIDLIFRDYPVYREFRGGYWCRWLNTTLPEANRWHRVDCEVYDRSRLNPTVETEDNSLNDSMLSVAGYAALLIVVLVGLVVCV
jgi:hypothetical protein